MAIDNDFKRKIIEELLANSPQMSVKFKQEFIKRVLEQPLEEIKDIQIVGGERHRVRQLLKDFQIRLDEAIASEVKLTEEAIKSSTKPGFNKPVINPDKPPRNRLRPIQEEFARTPQFRTARQIGLETYSDYEKQGREFEAQQRRQREALERQAQQEAVRRQAEQRAAQRAAEQEARSLAKQQEAERKAAERVAIEERKIIERRLQAVITTPKSEEKERNTSQSSSKAEELAAKDRAKAEREAAKIAEKAAQEQRKLEEKLQKEKEAQARAAQKAAEAEKAKAAKLEADNIRLRKLGESALDQYEFEGEIYRRYREDKPAIINDILQESRTDSNVERQKFTEADLNATLPGGVPTTARLSRIIQRSGFTIDDLKRVVQNQPTGVFDLAFDKVDEATGIQQRMMVSVDKYGGVLSRVRRQQQAFGEAIARDTIEFAKWSIAVGLILGPLTKLSEITQKAIENQSRLVDVTIAMGNAQKSTSEIFSNAYKIAQQSGESVEGVLDAFSLAYRAAGGIADENQRFSDASKLLSDSLVLSKLSTLNQADAIDILSAALKQTGTSFQDGIQLLDKWVAVSKNANIDIASLATGFAVMGETADAAGLSIDELNALLAITAEAGIASGKELANAGRRLVGAFQSDKAREQLTSLGIAIETTDGKMRSLIDVSKEITQLKKSGILSNSAYSDLTLALGGGVRGQALFSSFFAAFEKFNDVKEVSENATKGEAIKALGQQLETVETASTRLGNAFSSLAQSVGTKGGILDVFTAVLNTASKITEVFSGLTGIIGRTTPSIAALFAALAYNKFYLSQRPGLLTQFKQDFGGRVGGATSWILNNSSIAGAYFDRQNRSTDILAGVTPNSVATKAQLFAERNFTNILSAAGIAMSVGNNLLDKTSTGGEKATRIGADIAGGILGSFVGGPTGALIGSSIAEGFVNATLLYQPQFENFFTSSFGGKKPDEGLTEKEKVIEDWREKFQKEVFSRANIYGGIFGGSNDALALGGKTSSTILSSLLNLTGANTTPEDVALLLATRFGTNKKEIERLRELNPAVLQSSLPSAIRESQNIADFSGVQERLQREILSQLLSGKITPSVYKNYNEYLGKLQTSGNQLYQNVGKDFSKDVLGNVLTFGNKEERDYLIALNGTLNNLYDKLQTLPQGTEEYNKLSTEYGQVRSELVSYIEQINNAIIAKKQLPEIVDLSEYSDAVIKQIIASAKKLQESEYAGAGFTKEEYAAKVATFDPFLYRTKDKYQKETGLESRYVQQAIQEGMKNGTIPGIGLGFQTYDITRQQFEEAMAGYTPLLQQLEQFGYKEDASAQISIFKDGIVEPMKKDWKIVQYLLGEILKTNEKQLEGLYNFPSGITALVPWDAALLGRRDNNNLEETKPVVGSFPDESLREEEKYPTTLRKYPWVRFKETSEPWKFPVYGPEKPAGYDEAHMGLLPQETSKPSVYKLGPNGRIIRTDRNDVMNKELTSPLGLFSSLVSPAVSPTIGGFGMAAANALNSIGKTLQTKLSLAIENKTTLIVDGRTLANIVKKYMRDDLVRYGNASGNVARVNIV